MAILYEGKDSSSSVKAGKLINQVTDLQLLTEDQLHMCSIYEGVSNSPRTMLITRKSLVVHEFPATACCGGVLRVSVPSGWLGGSV